MNCRDLGGLPIAGGGTTCSGRVYRSGRLSNLAPADIARFDQLGIRQLVDLRLPFERERYPNDAPLARPPAQYQHGYLPAGAMAMFDAINAGDITVTQVHREMRRQYASMALDHGEIHAALCRRLIASEGLPTLVHCSAGKDRTGVASALLLRAAGVEREVVVADYLLTNADTPQLGVINADVASELVGAVGVAHASWIEAALDAVEHEFASVADFLRQRVGLATHEYEALIGVLTT